MFDTQPVPDALLTRRARETITPAEFDKATNVIPDIFGDPEGLKNLLALTDFVTFAHPKDISRPNEFANVFIQGLQRLSNSQIFFDDVCLLADSETAPSRSKKKADDYIEQHGLIQTKDGIPQEKGWHIEFQNSLKNQLSIVMIGIASSLGSKNPIAENMVKSLETPENTLDKYFNEKSAQSSALLLGKLLGDAYRLPDAEFSEVFHPTHPTHLLLEEIAQQRVFRELSDIRTPQAVLTDIWPSLLAIRKYHHNYLRNPIPKSLS